MLDGINLTLMAGPDVASPVPRAVAEAISEIEVQMPAQGPNGFQLAFTLSNRSVLQTLFLLAGGAQIEMLRMVIVVTVAGVAEVIADGVITHHQITPGTSPQYSSLTVTGEDLSRVMDYTPNDGEPFPAMAREARVEQLLGKYAGYGVVPSVVPPLLEDIPDPSSRTPQQVGTDLAYMKALADEIGYVFRVDPGPDPGQSTAYWGPNVRLGPIQPALNTNFDVLSNVESLNFTFDATTATTPIVAVQDETTNAISDVTAPDISPISPPLGQVPPLALREERISGAAKLTVSEGSLLAAARAADSSQAVRGQGTLDVVRYGGILQARQLVGVRGAGDAFDGLHFVESVTHRIKPGDYKQDFSLTRNGLLSTVSTVPV